MYGTLRSSKVHEILQIIAHINYLGVQKYMRYYKLLRTSTIVTYLSLIVDRDPPLTLLRP